MVGVGGGCGGVRRPLAFLSAPPALTQPTSRRGGVVAGASSTARPSLSPWPSRGSWRWRVTADADAAAVTRPFIPPHDHHATTIPTTTTTPTTTIMGAPVPPPRAVSSAAVAPPPLLNRERAVALEAVRRASALARSVQADCGVAGADAPASKADTSPVTVADFAVQALVVGALAVAFPDDVFIAEESSAALVDDPALRARVAGLVAAHASPLSSPGAPGAAAEAAVTATIGRCDHGGGDGRRTWILDPIDGTRGFVRQAQYCIALALVEGGEVVLGVLGCPNVGRSGAAYAPPPPPGGAAAAAAVAAGELGTLFHATIGGGAYELPEADVADAPVDGAADAPRGPFPPPGQRIHAATGGVTPAARLSQSVEAAHSRHALTARIAALLGVTAPAVRVDSQAKYGLLARGDVDAFLRFPRGGYVENVWDHAAGALVVTEAGGVVSDGTGAALAFGRGRSMGNKGGIVAAGGAVYPDLIKAVGVALAEDEEKPVA